MRVLDLVQRARTTRQQTFVDSTFRSYRADARGYVYFFLDRPGSDERTLVKTDQIALEVFWRAPDETHQRIVGMRDRKLLPTNIRYHLDHLTVVQDEFPDRIRLGDGDEVSDVAHPLAPGSEEVYDFRLADSLTLTLAGGADPVRVYELQVRPQRPDLPGFVGSVFVDRATGAIVRMRFTFTPASYVDPYLDYIRISLDNLLWEERHWLPYRQTAELRRELPQIDFAAGSIIRGRFEIGPYVFNEPIPDHLFRGGRVSAAPPSQRESFEFEDSLFAGLEEEGLATPVSIEEIRRKAREMAEDRYLSGLRRTRLYVPSASRVYRYGRAEGHVVGMGVRYGLSEDVTLFVHGGWSFGRGRATGRVVVGTQGRPWLELYANEPEDLGPFPAASTVLNTLAGLLTDTDWTDPYFVTGARITVGNASESSPAFLGVEGLGARWTLGYERHTSAGPAIADAGEYRPVRPVREDERLFQTLGLFWRGGAEVSDGWGAELRASLGLDSFGAGLDYGTARAAVAWARTGTWRSLDLSFRTDLGLSSGGPPQSLFLLGGRGTLLGHPFRHLVGDRFWLVRGEASRVVSDPWLSVRAFTSVGQAKLDDPLPGGWLGDPDAGVLGSAGAGVGLLWDVLHLDLGRGIGPGGDWEAAFSVARRFHGWL